MSDQPSGKPGAPAPPMTTSRLIDAPRAAVFEAWGNAESIKRWFSPAFFTIPEAKIDFRPGGQFEICMRAPTGQDFWSKGHYVEIVPPERLVSESSAIGLTGQPTFTALTTATFTEEGAGTRLDVRQEYTLFDPMMVAALAGAAEGWRTTLDKLEQEVARKKPGD